MDWQLIETAPERDMSVLLFFGKAKLPSALPHYRQERVVVGFYNAGTWCENGTGHDVFEPWREPDWTPTHWMPLPEAPEVSQ